jgi:hypothetical protein
LKPALDFSPKKYKIPMQLIWLFILVIPIACVDFTDFESGAVLKNEVKLKK